MVVQQLIKAGFYRIAVQHVRCPVLSGFSAKAVVSVLWGPHEMAICDAATKKANVYATLRAICL